MILISIVFLGFINQQTSLGGPHCIDDGSILISDVYDYNIPKMGVYHHPPNQIYHWFIIPQIKYNIPLIHHPPNQIYHATNAISYKKW